MVCRVHFLEESFRGSSQTQDVETRILMQEQCDLDSLARRVRRASCVTQQALGTLNKMERFPQADRTGWGLSKSTALAWQGRGRLGRFSKHNVVLALPNRDPSLVGMTGEIGQSHGPDGQAERFG